MQALLLATGETRKLWPLTEKIPSPMIPVLDRPVMVYNLELLGRIGFKHILVSVHSLAGSIEKYFGDGQRWGLSLEYVLQRDALGSAGAIRWAKQLLKETFIVFPADIIADIDITQAILEHTSMGGLATVIVQPSPHFENRSILVNSDGYVQSLDSSGGSNAWTDTGIYIFDPVILENIPPCLPIDIHQQLLPKLIDQKIPVFACPQPGYWNPLDTSQNYAEAQHEFLLKSQKEETLFEEKIAYRYHPLESRQIAHGIWAGHNVKIHPSAKMVPPSNIGHNSWIGKDVELGPGAVIGSNVVIDQGATVQDSIIIDNTYVGKLLHLKNRLVKQNQLIDLRTGEHVRVKDPILLGETISPSATITFMRPLGFILAVLILLVNLPLMMIIGILLLITTGQVFKRVPCRSARSFRQNSHSGLDECFDLLQFNTHKEDEQLVGFGRWLESWEGQRLPELWNILKGDLALVGLKPFLSGEESQIRAPWQLDQEEASAGFTGLWYIQTDEDSPLEESLIADAYYLATRSNAQDWKILWRTPSAWYRRARKQAVPGSASQQVLS